MKCGFYSLGGGEWDRFLGISGIVANFSCGQHFLKWLCTPISCIAYI